ncbi:ABC transporter permease [Neorhizobium sp. NCHU2750]|uniref:ABC transporter permease n=1 Tax=Neorhizobium sp. NCHU2750 TaxID=1825976 RepID=UPI000E70BFD5|nr:peptide/nickel ABC transporter permease [Neorhizobium sp. NCHU2750]
MTLTLSTNDDFRPDRSGPLRSLTFILAATVIGVMICAALLSIVWLPHDPTDFVTDEPFAPIGPGLWLGSDYMGRDVLSRLLEGTRLTLGMALSATVLAHLIGSSLGLVAAARGGATDMALSRIVDVILSLPKVIVGLVVVAALGPSIWVIVIMAAIVYSAGVFRIARALGADLARLEFIEIVKSRGENLAWVIFGEMLPHVIRPLAADFAIRTSFAILFMSSLSFVGLGVQPPLTDWGGMAHENLDGLSTNPWAALAPSIAIALVSISLNLLVDATERKMKW